MQDSFTVAKPPMGWNSWNTFYDQIDENLFLSIADVMADSGLADVGYEYLIIDDCWSHCTRDSAGRLKANPDRFPRGIKAVTRSQVRRRVSVALRTRAEIGRASCRERV